MTAPFFERLADRIERVDSVVSVGLDADRSRLPDHLAEKDLPQWAFNRRIIDETHEHAACYKPNAAFYEDAEGWRALRETIAYAHGKDVPVLLDAKRADIGNTTRQYAQLLDEVDAITVNPYMGRDSLQPFLDREDKGVFVLCRTSNPGGADLQDLELDSGEAVYERVAALADLWNEHGNVGLVVGATAPDELESIRAQVPDLPFLVPGIGAQGGDAEAAVEHGLAELDGAGDPGDGDSSADRTSSGVGVGLVNSSRGIIFAGEDEGEAFAKTAGNAARRLKRRLNQYRNDDA
ncbi:orotidine-5'-phosphate decarboxylase [Halobellus clavatus]|uniref:Orotidine 5'-phosphate decarboxylase n=1 Tax=Halobellus clavatus TaxID=660517 RepID=A0A1H3J606_9EURY|nr:orotidine-5'-phosphate decarboxylase [Halobellus clavatus]SDY34989.1 orotidine-5'-phosphate decarboxylase [Halobellus clavatus]